MKSNIVLIGMPGSGKSTIGKLLANELGKTAIDGDRIIEEKEGKKLQEIINEHGNDYFTKLEDEILSTLDCDNYVISPGGSVCYYPRAMAHLSEIAEVVYLKVSFPELQRRVHNLDSRGIVFKPNQTFEDLYNERTPLYEKYAGIVIDSTGLSPKATTKLLLDTLGICHKNKF